ncbi:hypothetical protein EJB05_03206 [Eragrostis curvula]|uniref:Uncharacterized protein n=1 Tax=Eragrostis curvula TaxID=38414 RepID=A0A5J9WSM5_9POAL|nr:hypothetical protein EJB05_03206 [Eragrostis curvula]
MANPGEDVPFGARRRREHRRTHGGAGFAIWGAGTHATSSSRPRQRPMAAAPLARVAVGAVVVVVPRMLAGPIMLAVVARASPRRIASMERRADQDPARARRRWSPPRLATPPHARGASLHRTVRRRAALPLHEPRLAVASPPLSLSRGAGEIGGKMI